MTALIVWACSLAYLAAGVLYARNRVTFWAENSTLFDPDDGADRAIFAMAGLACGVIWPLMMTFYGARDWLFRPTDRTAERIEQLEEDLKAWRARRYTGTTEEMAMAEQVVDTLENALKAVK